MKKSMLGLGAGAMLAGQVLMGCGGGSPTETKGSARESGNFLQQTETLNGKLPIAAEMSLLSM